MAAWLSGLVFLICCHVQPVSTADSCPLKKLGAHCDQSEKEKDFAKLSPDETQPGIDCCAFIPAFFDKTRNFDGGVQVVFASPATAANEIAAAPVRTESRTSSDLYCSPILSTKRTFLLNRTLRI